MFLETPARHPRPNPAQHNSGAPDRAQYPHSRHPVCSPDSFQAFVVPHPASSVLVVPAEKVPRFKIFPLRSRSRLPVFVEQQPTELACGVSQRRRPCDSELLQRLPSCQNAPVAARRELTPFSFYPFTPHVEFTVTGGKESRGGLGGAAPNRDFWKVTLADRTRQHEAVWMLYRGE